MEPVADADDLDDGDVTQVTVDGEKVLLAKVDGAFHAIGDICTHAHCHLSDGWLEGREIVCPCHHAKFDVATGDVTREPAEEPEPTFTVEVRDGQVYVGEQA